MNFNDHAVRLQRVGHSSVKTNMIDSHPETVLQKAASDAIWHRPQSAKREMESQKKEGEEKASLPLLSATPNQVVPRSP